MSVKYLRGLHPENLTDVCPSNDWGVYTPKIFDGCMSVKSLTHAHASVIWGVWLTDACPSNISGVYTPEIFDRCMSVKYLGGLYPQNI